MRASVARSNGSMGTAKHNYELLKLSLEDEIAASKTEMDEAKADKAEAEETKAAADGDLAVTSKDLALATEALSNIGSDCMEKATDHEVSQKGYAEELKALDTAKKIIQESTLLQKANSFLQTRASTRLRTMADLKNYEVVSVIKRLATQQHSSALAQLASRIAATLRYGSANGDDPFAKVKGLITEMIDKLMKEAADEASHKAYCDEEMGKTKAKKDELNSDIEKLTAKIDKATTKSADLKEQVKELQKELAELADTQAEMEKVREDSHATFVEEQAELTKGLDGIRKALEVLRNYYESKEEALIQDNSQFSAFMQQPAVPEKHAPSGGAGGGSHSRQFPVQ